MSRASWMPSADFVPPTDDEENKVNEKRLRAAILGAFVADAASMGTHNYTDLDALAKAVPSKEEPEFKDPPAPLEYSAAEYPGHYGPGQPSPHGEQLLFATEYCGKHMCVTGGHMSVRYKEYAESFGGLQDSTTKEFLELMKELDRSVELIGADNNRALCFMKVVPVTCLYAGELDMLERVHEAIMIHQTNKSAIDFGMAFAQLLETIILGGSLKEALEKTVTWCISQGHDEVMDACIRALSEAKMKTLDQVMEDLTSEELGGRSNQLPAAFIVPMYIFYKALGDGDVTEETYIKALRENIMAGGDTCCRAVFIGAVLAACAESVPQKWVEKTDKECIKKLEQATKSIVESVG